MDGNAPAWMECDDLITRLKDELILEAVDILHEEIRNGRIDIKGYVAALQDKPDELQRDMFIINNIVERENEIVEKAAPYLDNLDAENDPDRVKRIEDLNKFMLSVRSISMLMRLSRLAEAWGEDTGKFSKLGSVREVMIESAKIDPERMEVVRFVTGSARFARSGALDDSEMGMLRDIIKSLPQA